jgi:threonine synthase
VQLAPNHFLLELFHGPTLAFKDFAMQLIGQLFQAALTRRGRAGDHRRRHLRRHRLGRDRGVPRARRGVDVFILYPHGRVSEVQRRQMTTPTEANVHALALDGTFDDCQARLKDMFNDFAFRDEGAAGRRQLDQLGAGAGAGGLLFHRRRQPGRAAPPVSFTVPTGNFGDIFAGYIARRMGLPIEQLVIATNQNDILHRC